MITDFLKTKQTKLALETTLNVLREFKACESEEEWLWISSGAWAKLEQFQEFLEHLVEGTELKDDTIAYMERKS